MRMAHRSRIMLQVLLVIAGLFASSTAFATTYARTFRAYYGLETTPTNRSVTNYKNIVFGASGLGGTISVSGNSGNLVFGSSVTGNSADNSGNSSNQVTINPGNGYQIKSIYWIDSTNGTSTNISDWTGSYAPNPKTNTVVLGMTGTPPSGTTYFSTGPGNTSRTKSNTAYDIWVVFEPIPVATYTVTGIRYPADFSGCQNFTPTSNCAGYQNGACDCDPASDAYICSQTGYIGTTAGATTTAISESRLATDTPTYYLGNSNPACEVHMESEDMGASWTTTDLHPAGGPYTTITPGPFSNNYTFLVGFSKKHFTITSTNDPAGVTTCGTLTPNTNSYTIGSSQTFNILPNSNCAIASVTVTDPNAGYVSKDVTALARINGNAYTFDNIQAAGSITVKFAVVSTTTGGQYCQVPAFIPSQTNLKPNALLIFDNSGSMGDYPYVANSSVKPYTCNTSGTTTTAPTGQACTLSNINNFYGYFDNTKMYSYDATSNIFTVSNTTLSYKKPSVSSCSQLSTGTVLSGNALNYLCMQKLDIVKKILVGGKVDPSKGAARFAADGSTYYYLKTADGNWVQSTLTEPTGLVHGAIDKVRFGLMTFNYNQSDVGSGDGATLITPIGSDLATLVSNIEAVSKNGNTPLAESYYEAIRYFQGLTSPYNSGVDYGTMDPIQYSCQKNFVIQLTDGEPTADANVPTSSSSGALTDANVTAWWNGLSAANKPPNSYTGNSSYPYLPRLTYYAHTNDLRTSTVGKSDIASIQNLTYYAVYAFGDGSGKATLQAAAKYGGFVDQNNNNVPDLAAEYPNNNNYFEATSGDVLEANLANVFSSIISSTASGTAAAVANNKSGQRGANIVQALFYPQWPNDGMIHWLGEVQNMWFYLSPNMANTSIYEDTDGNKELNPTIDKGAPTNPFYSKTIWRAGAKLQATTAASRNIYTLLDSGSALTSSANAFSSSNAATLKATGMMNVAGLTTTAAGTLIDYIRGVDNVLYRPRVVSFTDPFTGTMTTDVWKLGDVINSTPQIQSPIAINSYQTSYNDGSYARYIGGTQYKNRNIVYTGANDGMLHAFRLGVVSSITDSSNPARIAKITGSDLGTEEWAFIPKNALPYLQNQAGTAYCHQALVDGAPTLVDASIFKADCAESNYWDCPRKTTINSDGSIDTTKTNWGTVLVGSMGLGGASRDINGSCNETTVHTGVPSQNVDCVYTPVANNGLSSYFALDVSTPLSPKLMWEFSDYSINAADKGLGFTTPGAAVVRINSHDKTTGKPQNSTNGRWFAVFASGPTGAIATSQFTGRSDQNLKLYIVDLNGGPTFNKCTSAGQSNCNYWVKDTGIKYAFANSINGVSIDLDRWNTAQDGNYSDDVLYITYTKATLDSNGFPTNSRSSAGGTDTPTPWEKGGVMRLVTNHNPDPYTWFTSSLIDNTGPITSAVGILQDRKSTSLWNAPKQGNLWIYFGEGRYYFPGDDLNPTRKFYGVSDPCYNQYTKSTSSYSQYSGDSYLQYALGTTVSDCPAVSTANLADQSSASTNSLPSGKQGWYVSMAAANTSVASAQTGAERVLGDVSAALNGVVQFTTFTPNTDVCVPGGNTSMWAVSYNSGGPVPNASLVGKTPVQTSGGGITLVDLSTVFTKENNRKLDGTIMITNSDGTTSTLASSLAGMASKDRAKSVQSNPPRKRIIHSQEY
jgi:type IV pilus assembly protein PilY1